VRDLHRHNQWTFVHAAQGRRTEPSGGLHDPFTCLSLDSGMAIDAARVTQARYTKVQFAFGPSGAVIEEAAKAAAGQAPTTPYP
jgi:hypothetical protein